MKERPHDPSLFVLCSWIGQGTIFFVLRRQFLALAYFVVKWSLWFLLGSENKKKAMNIFLFFFFNILTFLHNRENSLLFSCSLCLSIYLPFSLTYFIETDKTDGFTVSQTSRHTTDFTLWAVEGGTIPNQH